MLPKDASNDSLHTSTSEGGLGIPSILALSKRSKNTRPRKTLAREDRVMQRMSLKDRFKSCTEIKRVMNSTSCINVSRQTVSRRLQEIGLFNRTPRKKPLVSSKRLEFANRYVIWTHENWVKVFFSDESKFNLLGNHGKKTM